MESSGRAGEGEGVPKSVWPTRLRADGIWLIAQTKQGREDRPSPSAGVRLVDDLKFARDRMTRRIFSPHSKHDGKCVEVGRREDIYGIPGLRLRGVIRWHIHNRET